MRTLFFAALLSVAGCLWGEGISPPSGFPILEKEGFVLQYDSRGKVPLWTWEVLTKESLEKNAKREGISFCSDSSLPPVARAELKDYRGSGFDRGHMVPAADQTISKRCLKDTFLLSNICPQNANLNRNFWKSLEIHIRNHIRKRGWEKLTVATGTLFLPYEENGKKYVKYQVIGDNNVAVPTHIFKLVFAEKGNLSKTWCYIVPNEPVPKETPFEKYEVSLEYLEKVSGLVFQGE